MSKSTTATSDTPRDERIERLESLAEMCDDEVGQLAEGLAQVLKKEDKTS